MIDENKPAYEKSIPHTIPDDTKKDKNDKQKEPRKNPNGKLFGKSGYDTLTEEETYEDSMLNLPRRSPPTSYSSTVQTTDVCSKQSSNQPESTVNCVIPVKVHVMPE